MDKCHSDTQNFPASVLQPLEDAGGLLIIVEILVRVPLYHQLFHALPLLCIGQALQILEANFNFDQSVRLHG